MKAFMLLSFRLEGLVYDSLLCGADRQEFHFQCIYICHFACQC